MLSTADLKLRWPPDLFAAEARALLDADAQDRDSLGLLLAEAFHGGRGLSLYDQVDAMPLPPPLIDRRPGRSSDTFPDPPRPAEQLVRDLVAQADQLPRYVSKQLYSARRRPPSGSVLTSPDLRAAWAGEIDRLARTGYFEEAFGSSCVDADGDPDAEGQRQLADLVGTDRPVWPPAGMTRTWTDELFLDVIEALHELVARPRRRWWHGSVGEWDYSSFSGPAGQAVYRWRTNAVLARSEMGLRLADAGEEAGLLVRVAGDDRDQLTARVIEVEVEAEPDVRAHAAAKFRGRGAGVPEKRSAIVDLAGLLENRRRLLKAELLRKDEGALFDIANNFDLRHRRADQRGDYDEAFLDWIFWWYLGTLDLTDRLLARQAASAAAAGS